MSPLLLALLSGCTDFFLGEEPNLVFPDDTAVPVCACEGLDCPCSSVRNDDTGRWYLFSWPMALTWSDARVFCQDRLEGDLAVLADVDEPAWVASKVGQTYERDDPWWLGLTDQVAEGTWLWVDGMPLEAGAPWGAGEPSAESDSVDCAALRIAGTEGTWEDDVCDVPQYFVCEGSLQTLGR